MRAHSFLDVIAELLFRNAIGKANLLLLKKLLTEFGRSASTLLCLLSAFLSESKLLSLCLFKHRWSEALCDFVFWSDFHSSLNKEGMDLKRIIRDEA